MKSMILSLFFILIISCSRNSDPVSAGSNDSSFGIYFLKDSSLTELDIAKAEIHNLILNDNAWLKEDDIEFYDFSTHCIYLKNDKTCFFDNYREKYYQFNPTLISRPFVVVAGNKRCYVGAFHSGLLSISPLGPYIDELDVGFYPDDILHISRAWSDDEDIRSNPQIKSCLLKLDKFHAGLDIELTSFKIIDNSDTSIVEYSIKITNHDQDNLYIIDSDKMGSELFHNYTNGPDLWDISNSKYFYSQYKNVESPEPYDSWDFDWFSLIKSNQSIDRTIRLKGYPFIPNGDYVGSINFSNPRNIKKIDRNVVNGRIWIGSIKSKELKIKV